MKTKRSSLRNSVVENNQNKTEVVSKNLTDITVTNNKMSVSLDGGKTFLSVGVSADEFDDLKNDVGILTSDVNQNSDSITVLRTEVDGNTNEIDNLKTNKLDESSISQTSGQATNLIMSQKATTDALNLKVNNSQIVQNTGESTSNIMSQKAVSDAISNAGAVTVLNWQPDYSGRLSFTVNEYSYPNTTYPGFSEFYWKFNGYRTWSGTTFPTVALNAYHGKPCRVQIKCRTGSIDTYWNFYGTIQSTSSSSWYVTNQNLMVTFNVGTSDSFLNPGSFLWGINSTGVGFRATSIDTLLTIWGVKIDIL